MKAVTSVLISLLFLDFVSAAQPIARAPRRLITGSDFPDCTIGTVFFNTAAPIGKNFFLCTSALVWAEKNPKDLGIFDVKQFGAHGDGRSDDQALIQAASESASGTAGGIVFFPPGT